MNTPEGYTFMSLSQKYLVWEYREARTKVINKDDAGFHNALKYIISFFFDPAGSLMWYVKWKPKKK